MDFNQWLLKNFVAPTNKALQNAKTKYGAIYKSRDDRSMNDLKTDDFSGIRANDMWNRLEFWILGNMHDSIPYQEFALNPQLLNEKYMEIFGMKEVRLTDDVERVVKKLQDSAKTVHAAEEGDLLFPNKPVVTAADFQHLPSSMRPKK